MKEGICMFRGLRNIAIATRTNRIRTVGKLSPFAIMMLIPDLKVALGSRYNHEDCIDVNNAAVIA